MSAFVRVLPNPYYTWVGADGGFTIDGVPPGNYTLTVWNELLGAVVSGYEIGDALAGSVKNFASCEVVLSTRPLFSQSN